MDARGTLKEILDTMDVPELRKNLGPQDLPWLVRNMWIKNKQHPRYREALQIAVELSTLRGPLVDFLLND